MGVRPKGTCGWPARRTPGQPPRRRTPLACYSRTERRYLTGRGTKGEGHPTSSPRPNGAAIAGSVACRGVHGRDPPAPRPTPSASRSSRNRSTTIGVTDINFREPRRGTICTLMEMLTCSPVEYPVIRRCRRNHCLVNSATVCRPNCLRASATGGSVLLLRVDLYEAVDRLVLRREAALLKLLPHAVTETDRVRVQAPGRSGTAAVLEERAHTASELSSHVASLPSESWASAPRLRCRGHRVSKRRDFPRPMLTIC
jgi:hypothetical protein